VKTPKLCEDSVVYEYAGVEYDTPIVEYDARVE
jgi:hypothetical protein